MPEPGRRPAFPVLCPPRLAVALAAGWLLVLVAPTAPMCWADAEPPQPPAQTLPPEVPDDPPGKPAQPVPGAAAAAAVSFGRFTSIQVNVAAGGVNISGDAANEPSIAVDPTNYTRKAIGWRQFDTISSNFREAGYAYTTNSGATWTKGEIESGTFRSDPVLGFDAGGKFFYNSLSQPSAFETRVFPSTDGGATWGASAFAYGGDKQWMAIDRTGGQGNGNVYQAWSTASNPTPGNTFDRSINAGASFQTPTSIPNSPIWGTLDVGPDGTLYLCGTTGPGGTIYVSRSLNAKNSAVTPTFTTNIVNLGGTIQMGGPNPQGLLGQLWIGVDRSAGPRSGWVYVLASVKTATDPLDVMFIRSTDGGQTWSTPVRVNDDPSGNNAWQWFATMSVAPDGRIEAVWNDSRTTGNSSMTALFYSYSIDGGVTWSANEQASPVWDSQVGWPNQSKIGDYYHMVSDMTGADLAWAATFNSEQDVYYLRIPRVPVAAVADPERALRLGAVHPNPFTSFATVEYDVPSAGGRVKLEVFDVSGRHVATLVDGVVPGGPQAARWSGMDDETGRAAAPGVYLCRLEAPGTPVRTARFLRLR